MTLDWQAIGTAATAIFIGIGGWLTGRKSNKAKAEAAIEQARADGAAATAEKSVVDLMREEVSRLSQRVSALETREGRLIRHVYRLEGLMRGANLTPPPFDIDNDAFRAGLTD